MSNKILKSIDKNININNNIFAGIIALTAGVVTIGYGLKSIANMILFVLGILVLSLFIFSYFVRLDLIDNLIAQLKEDK